MLTVTKSATIPDGAAHLFPGSPFDASPQWFHTVAATAVPAGCRPFFLVVAEGGRPVALWPLLTHGSGVMSLTCPYTLHYAPAFAGPACVRAAGVALRRWGVVQLEALDADTLAEIAVSLRAARLLTLRYSNFGNWHERAADWPSYLAARPGPLRETIRRRLRAVADGRLRPDFTHSDSALSAYEEVHRSSWKLPEPFPAFAPRFLRDAAEAGILRMSVLRHENRPVAAQYWTVENGTATVLKLAHDESLKRLSPGTVLTALTVQRLFEQDGVTEIDFGRGDDAYKQLWAGARRQRMGALIINPLHPAGMRAAVRHAAGRVVRAVAKIRRSL